VRLNNRVDVGPPEPHRGFVAMVGGARFIPAVLFANAEDKASLLKVADVSVNRRSRLSPLNGGFTLTETIASNFTVVPSFHFDSKGGQAWAQRLILGAMCAT
jgi:hypothetical protein